MCVCMYVCMYVCIYVCMYVCMYVYIYIYIYIYSNNPVMHLNLAASARRPTLDQRDDAVRHLHSPLACVSIRTSVCTSKASKLSTFSVICIPMPVKPDFLFFCARRLVRVSICTFVLERKYN
jgi:hypothetical protein